MQVMDMEHELRALRIQLAEKSKHSVQLQKVYRLPFSSVDFVSQFFLAVLVSIVEGTFLRV